MARQRLTIATCIGCGAMSLPSGCPGGCGPERKLELVAGADVDLLLDLAARSRQRAEALAAVVQDFVESSTGATGGPGEPARAALRAHEEALPAAVGQMAAAAETVVAWWCERCGGLEAPAPCVGVCIRQPAQWATLGEWEEAHAAAADVHEVELQLARTARALLFTRARAGREREHRRALRTTARRALRLWAPVGVTLEVSTPRKG